MNRYFVFTLLATCLALMFNGIPVFGQSCSVNTLACGYNTPTANCCTICLALDGCMWCEKEGVCTQGDYFGPNNQVTCSKTHAFYGTCKLESIWLLVIIGSGLGIVVIVLFLIICCCCVLRRYGKWRKRRDDVEDAEVESQMRLLSQRKQQTQRSREEINAKYGLK